MSNELSRKVYNEIIAEGLVGELQGRVAGALVDSEPLTANEIGKKIEVPQRTTFAPRLLELEKTGVVRKAGKRPCTVTGRTGHTFELTGNKPTPYSKKKPVEVVGQVVSFGGVGGNMYYGPDQKFHVVVEITRAQWNSLVYPGVARLS